MNPPTWAQRRAWMAQWHSAAVDTAMSSRYDAEIAQLAPDERFLRALALSACVRSLAWQGARLNAETPDTAGVALRFVRQLYGDDVALMWQRRTAAWKRE